MGLENNAIIGCGVAGTDPLWNNDWHIAALFIIIGTSAFGVFIPILSRTSRSVGALAIPMYVIQFGQFFGAGVIIATAFIHLFPAAHSALSSTCLGSFADRYSAWASLFAMAAVFTMHSIEWWLVEAWFSRTAGGYGSGCDRSHAGPLDGAGVNDGESFDDQLFPAYSRAFNASRLILPPPALSPPIHPLVFGTSTVSPSVAAAGMAPSTFASHAGFSLSKYANYAALVQSRQHLAMMHCDQMSRHLHSDPQFPLYSPSIWPMPPSAAHLHLGAVIMHGGAQAKSTPELMRRNPKSSRTSNASSSSAKPATNSSNAISLRPDSFTNQARGLSSKAKRASRSWKHRCLSMPRMPPTTLEAAICESLLEPLPPIPGAAGPQPLAANVAPPLPMLPHASRDTQFVRGSRATTPDSGASSRDFVSNKGHSRNMSASRANRPSVCGTYESSPGRLDPLPENGDSWVASVPHRSSAANSVQSGADLVDEAVAGTRHTPRVASTDCEGKSRKRVSIPTPPLLLPPSGMLPHTNIAMPRDEVTCSQGCAEHAAGGGGGSRMHSSNNEEDSTAIHSKCSSLTKITYPVEVKRRALATYILELGIALYSVLIGLALAVSDRGFTALLIAVCFHQLFEGLALGTSLAELYWIKAQIAAHGRAALYAEGLEEPPVHPDHNEQRGVHGDGSEARVNLGDVGNQQVNVQLVQSTTFPTGNSNGVYQQQQQAQQQQHGRRQVSCEEQRNMQHNLRMQDRQNRCSKSRRTLTSLATSFTPEPWQVNPHLEKSLGGQIRAHVYDEGLSAARGPSMSVPPNAQAAPLGRYLQPRAEPERLPGWWKAWISALAFTFTTPIGIIIGLALRHVYEPNSRYALLFNGVLQSICTGILIYAGLVTLMIGGFNSYQFKQLPRVFQAVLFFAVYAGAAAMASLKIWK